jgi:DNA-binding PadR family transcriptional regulator
VRHVTDEPIQPLGQPVFAILLSLAEEPRHGYALMKDIETISGGQVRLTTGTLYGALRRLLESGWIAPFDQPDTSRDKQAYRLTASGRRRLKLEVDRLKNLTRVATLRLRKGEA